MADGLEIRKDILKPQKEDGKAEAEEEVVLQEMMETMIMMIEEPVHIRVEEIVVVPVQDHHLEEDGTEIRKDMQMPQRKAGKIVNNNNREIEISISFFSFLKINHMPATAIKKRTRGSIRKKTGKKTLTNSNKPDVSHSYNKYKEYEGKQYTGMQIGRSLKWYYDKGEWRDRKITPDFWEISYAVTKRRAGHA